MAQRKQERGTDVIVDSARFLWRYRTELTLLSVVFWMAMFLSFRYSSTTVGIAVTGLTWLAVMGNGYLRPWLLRRLGFASLRRRMVTAVMDARKTNKEPLVLKVNDSPVGEQVTLRVQSGDDVEALIASQSKLAASLHVASVRVTKDPDRKRDSSRALITLVRHDPLDTLVPFEWPLQYAPSFSVYDPIPVAVDEFGVTRYMVLVKQDGARSCLLGGLMGSGKSNALSLLAGATALDPDSDLWIFDGKGYELNDWEPVCKLWVGQEGMETYQGLQAIQSIMNERKTEMRARGQRHIVRGDGIRPQIVIVDELAWYASLKSTNVGKKPVGSAIQDVATDIVRRGRSAGVFMAVGIQRPSHDVIDTSLRDLFGYRWGFRQETSESNDMVLGSRAASLGYDTTQITERDEEKGIGFLAAEGGAPVRTKAFRLDDEQVRNIVSRAIGLRIDQSWGQTEVPILDEDETA